MEPGEVSLGRVVNHRDDETATAVLALDIDGDTVRITRLIFTDKLPGTNRVVITVNPRLQPEHSFLNNTLSLQLPVLPDNTGPLLEVAVDGQRIADGAVVSAGGRVLGIGASAPDLRAARAAAYRAVDALDWPGGFCRRDIAHRAF